MVYLNKTDRVIDRNGSIYTLQNLSTNKEEVYHISDMKRFEYDPEVTNPREVANRDYHMVDVRSITSHRFTNSKQISTYEFYVNWEGLSDNEST